MYIKIEISPGEPAVVADTANGYWVRLLPTSLDAALVQRLAASRRTSVADEDDEAMKRGDEEMRKRDASEVRIENWDPRWVVWMVSVALMSDWARSPLWRRMGLVPTSTLAGVVPLPPNPCVMPTAVRDIK